MIYRCRECDATIEGLVPADGLCSKCRNPTCSVCDRPVTALEEHQLSIGLPDHEYDFIRGHKSCCDALNEDLETVVVKDLLKLAREKGGSVAKLLETIPRKVAV